LTTKLQTHALEQGRKNISIKSAQLFVRLYAIASHDLSARTRPVTLALEPVLLNPEKSRFRLPSGAVVVRFDQAPLD
jgi:hypothetical protein